jgi:hypothetical protein
MVTRAAASLDMVHLFVTEAAGSAGELEHLREAIAPDGTKDQRGVPKR